MHGEAADFLECEIGRIPMTVAAPAVGKFLFDVGGVLEFDVMKTNEGAVLSEDKVGLDIVGIHRVGHRVGFERMLGDVSAGAAVGDDDGSLRRGRPGEHEGGDEREQQYRRGTLVHGENLVRVGFHWRSRRLV